MAPRIPEPLQLPTFVCSSHGPDLLGSLPQIPPPPSSPLGSNPQGNALGPCFHALPPPRCPPNPPPPRAPATVSRYPPPPSLGCIRHLPQPIPTHALRSPSSLSSPRLAPSRPFRPQTPPLALPSFPRHPPLPSSAFFPSPCSSPLPSSFDRHPLPTSSTPSRSALEDSAAHCSASPSSCLPHPLQGLLGPPPARYSQPSIATTHLHPGLRRRAPPWSLTGRQAASRLPSLPFGSLCVCFSRRRGRRGHFHAARHPPLADLPGSQARWPRPDQLPAADRPTRLVVVTAAAKGRPSPRSLRWPRHRYPQVRGNGSARLSTQPYPSPPYVASDHVAVRA